MSAVKADGAWESLRVSLDKSGDFAMNSIARNIADLVEELNIYHLKPKIQGMDLLIYNHDPKKMVEFIQQNSILKNPEDIQRVLSWRLQSLQGNNPLSGINYETAELLYNSIFDYEKLITSLATSKEPLDIVLFRKGTSQQLTSILKTLPNVRVKIILSGTDDGANWFYGAREFNATGISGAGRALLDLARDRKTVNFLEVRIAGDGMDDKDLETSFQKLVLKMINSRLKVNLSDEMKEIYIKFTQMDVDKRQKIILHLQSFLDFWARAKKGNHATQFTLRNISLRSLVLVGLAKQHHDDWQFAINQLAKLLNVETGNEVILPTTERQHLIGIRKDGTIYFSETGISLHITNSPFLGLWLVNQKTYQDLLNQGSFSLNGQNIPIKRITLAADNPLQESEQQEVIETTREISPEFAVAFAGYLAKVSSTDKLSTQKISLTAQTKKILKAADIILYSNGPSFETDVGGALIVPGVGQAIKENEHAIKVNLVEVSENHQQEDFIDYLERGHRYLTGHLKYENPLVDWRDIDHYVNYVLGGELSNHKVSALADVLIDLEQVTGNRVNAVSFNAQVFKGQHFFSSMSLIGSLMALRAINQAGFVISNDGGLIRHVDSRHERAQAPLGLFNRDHRVSELIKKIRRNWPQIVKQGAFVFDVDQTILPKGSKGLDEYRELAYLFMRLLHEDVKVAIISGNSQSEQMKKIYQAIKVEMKDDLSAFKNLTLYVNAGATKIVFKTNKGDAVLDEKYNASHGLDAKIMLGVIHDVLKEMASKNFGLTKLEMERFTEEIKEYLKKNYPKMVYTILGKDWHPYEMSEEDIAEAIKSRRKVSIPWIEKRGEFKERNKYFVASLAIKPTPRFEFNGSAYDVRKFLQTRIKERLKEMGQDVENFKIRSGGSSTTDITQVNTEKSKALLDFISTNKRAPQWVFYLGDEFFIRDGKEGNDEVIAREPELADVRTLAVNVDNIEGAHKKTLWMGRSPQATLEFLASILRRDAAMTGFNKGGIDLDQININSTSRTIKVQFDPAQLDELLQDGFEGFSPVIINIVPIQNPLQFMGVKTSIVKSQA